MATTLQQFKDLYKNKAAQLASSRPAVAIENIQRRIESPKSFTPFPRLDINDKQSTPTRIGRTVANIPSELGNSLLGAGYLNVISDVGRTAGQTLRGDGIPRYGSLKSGPAKLAYNFSGINATPRQFVGNVGQTVVPIMDAYGGGKIFNIGKEGIEQLGRQGLKSSFKRGSITGAKYGASDAFARSLDLNRDAQTRREYMTKILLDTAAGTAAGYGLGGLISVGGQAVGRVSERVVNAVSRLFPDKTEGEQIKIARTFVRDSFGRFAEQEGLYKGKEEPVFYGDLRESLGMPRDGFKPPQIGLTTKLVNQLEKTQPEGVGASKDIVQKTQSTLDTSKGTAKLEPSTKEYSDLSSISILPEKGKLNVQNLNLTKDQQKLVRSADEGIPTVIGNKDVVKTSILTSGAKGAMSDAQQQELLARRLNSRQSVVTLTKEFEQLKKTGASEAELLEKFGEIADQSRIAQQEGTFAGRQLQSQKILSDELATPQQKILALLDNAGVDKKKYLKDAVNVDWNNSKEVVAFYRKYVPAKLGELLTEYRYTNMLSSPLTHIVNTGTNLLQTGVVTPIEKTITGGLDFLKSTLTGSERKYYASDGIKYTQGYYKALPGAWKAFADTVTGKEVNIKPDIERIPVQAGRAFEAYTLPLKALEGADQFFMELVKGGEASSLAGRGLTSSQINTKATNAAKYRLFRQDFDPQGNLGQGYVLRVWDHYNSVVNQLRRVPGGNWIVPFLKTPTNILKQGVEYSPLGVTTLPGSREPLEQLSKTIIGTSVFLGVYSLLDSVAFTWEVPNGKKERDYFYAANMQPYSVKIGDKWVSYSKLGPLSYPVAMAAALRYAEKKKLSSDKENAISTAVGGMMKMFADQSYVKQLGDFMDALQTGQGITGAIKAEGANIVSQLIPYRSFLGWVSRMVDPVNRKSNTFTSKITNQIPFVSKQNEAYYNPITGGESMRSNRFLNSFSPVRITTTDKSAEEMYNYASNAKRAYSNLKSLPKEEAAEMFKKISEYSPAMAREISRVAEDEKLGLTSKEKTIKNLGVGSGERAYELANEFKKLKTKEEKAEMWKRYVELGIITKDVAVQLNELFKNGQI